MFRLVSTAVVLTAAAPAPVDGADWLVRVSRRNARKLLTELLTGWAKAESPDR